LIPPATIYPPRMCLAKSALHRLTRVATPT
jgi:hypothetical protein